MMANSACSFGDTRVIAWLLALACAACSAPMATETAVPMQDAGPVASRQDLATAKEAAPRPKAAPKVRTPGRAEQELETGV